MRLMVCPKTQVSAYADAPVTHFVSLVDPGEDDIPEAPRNAIEVVQLVFSDLDDLEMTIPKYAGLTAPEPDHVAEMVSLGRRLADLDDWGLLTHCEAGISRSTAAAIAILTAAGYPPQIAFGLVRRVCPEMLPNRRILRLADECLCTSGKLLHMAEIHRAKAFARAGYEDPTNVLVAEARAGVLRRPGLLDRLLALMPAGWRNLVGTGARMRAIRAGGHAAAGPTHARFVR